eukprot:jgi/Bigna1/70467/fgenesh1_pg.12_\
MGCKGSRFEKTPLVPANELKRLLNEHQVEGIVLTWFEGHRVSSQCAGFADAKHEQKMSKDIWLPFGMMGQDHAYASKRHEGRRHGPKDLTLHHLFRHTSGLQQQQERLSCSTTEKESASDSESASSLDIGRLILSAKPGTAAHLTDTNFLLLEHIIELLEGGGGSLKKSLRRYLDSSGMKNADIWNSFAKGRVVDSSTAYSSSLGNKNSCLFNALCGTSESLAHFLLLLGTAYATKDHGIIHEQAGGALPKGTNYLRDIESARADLLGTMIFSAGPNRIMFQYTNMYGLRGLYISCFKGPDAKQGPSGLLILCRGFSERAVSIVCIVARMLLLQLNWEGVNFMKVDGNDKQPSFCCPQPAKTSMLNTLRKYVIEAFTDE